MNKDNEIDYIMVTPDQIPDETLTPFMATTLVEDGIISAEEYNKYMANPTYIPKLQIVRN